MQTAARQTVKPHRRTNKSAHRLRGWIAAAVAMTMTLSLTACNDDETSGAAVADSAALTTTTSTEPTDAESAPDDDTATDGADADPSSETSSVDKTTAPAPPPVAPAPDSDPDPNPDTNPDSAPSGPADPDDRFAEDDEWEIEGPKELILPPEDEALTEEECLLGTWYFSNAVFNDQLQELAGSVGNIDVSGRAKTTFYPDGTLTSVYDNWTMTGVPVAAPGKFTMVRSGTDNGTYTAKDGDMTVQDTSMTATIDLTIEAGGQVTKMQTPPAGLENQKVTYMCFPMILTLTDADGFMSIKGRSAAFE